MAHHPGRRASWPVEIRELYDTVVRAADARELSAFTAALDRLVMLADRSDDAVVKKAARLACVKLALMYDPEGVAACIANSVEFPGALRSLIDTGAPGPRRRPRTRRRRGSPPRST